MEEGIGGLGKNGDASRGRVQRVDGLRIEAYFI
jgi:hypothetical protein